MDPQLSLRTSDVHRLIDRYKENESAFDISVHPYRPVESTGER